MATYLSVNSTFQPFSYQELVAPVAHQQQVLDNLAEQYDKLSSQADVLEAMGKNDRDKNSGTYSRYKAYSDKLREEADNLYKFGLNSESRQRLTDLRRMYNTEIVPIQNAWNKREQESADQMKAQLANPSLMFTRDARNSNLDEYIKNPTGGYGVINGANITAQMSAMAKNLEKQIRNGDSTLEKIDPYTYNHIRRFGLDANMIRDWRTNDTLKKMFSQVMQANGVTPEALQGSLNAQSIMDKSTGYAEMGMWNAIGEDKSQIIENYGARLQAQMEKELAVAKAGAGNGSKTTSAFINPSNIYSAEEAAEQNKRIKEYEKFFTTTADGKSILSRAGLEEYNRNATPNASLAQSGGGTARLMNAETNLDNSNRKFTPTKFKEFIDEIGGADMMKKKQYGNIGNLWNQYKTKDFLQYDASRLTEYNHSIDPSEYNNWTDRIRERAGGELEEVEWDKKQKKWISKGKVPVSEVFKEKSNPTSTQSSIYGRTFRVVDKDGNVKRYRMPRGINTRAEQNIDVHLNALSQIQSLANQLDRNGQKRLTVDEARQLNQSVGRNVFTAGTVIDYATLQRVNADLEDRLATFESQMGVTNTNKPQEWNAIPY